MNLIPLLKVAFINFLLFVEENKSLRSDYTDYTVGILPLQIETSPSRYTALGEEREKLSQIIVSFIKDENSFINNDSQWLKLLLFENGILKFAYYLVCELK